MQDDEVAHALELLDHLLVVVRDVDRIERGVGEVVQQRVHAAADQMNAGGLERLDESRAQAERDAVCVPELAATAGHEADEARLGQRLGVLGHAEQVPQPLPRR